MKLASVKGFQGLKKKKPAIKKEVSMSVSSGNVMKIYKYFVCTRVEECSSTREADGHASISKKKMNKSSLSPT